MTTKEYDEITGSRPLLILPSLRPVAAFGQGSAKPAGDEMVARFAELPDGEMRPTLTVSPEAAEETVAEDGGAGGWISGVTVTATWSIAQTRNAWILVQGVWKKIYNGGDGAFTALLTLATQARQTGSPITYREEPDGLVHEIYLW